VSAMCRKCLSSASEESRRCKSCGGPIVRFDEGGGMVEMAEAAEEDGPSGGIPPLFADLDTGWPRPPAQHGQPPQPATAQPVQAPAAPATPPVPGTVQPSGTLIMPASQLDDVVSGMLRPFGFERPEEPRHGSSPLQGSPINQSVGNAAPQVSPNQEPTVPFFSRSAPPKPVPETQPVDNATTSEPSPPAGTGPTEPRSAGVQAQVSHGESADDRPGEDALSMAAMVRDIMAISDQDPASGSASQQAGSSASDDLMIGPAGRGFRKRSKAAPSRRSGKSQGSDSEDPMAELTQDAAQTRSRSRSR
jgi:hypothetical protein